MQRIAHELWFTTSDSTQLFYRKWPASTDRPAGLIVLLHRGHEHSGRLQHLVDELELPDYEICAWDARGHGHSSGQRGYSPGIGRSIRDLDEFVAHLLAEGGLKMQQVAVIAQSVGAVLASAWVHDYAPPIRALTLASPAFKVKLYLPFARNGLKLLQLARGNFFISSYVSARLLTHDPERIESYASDSLITRDISVNMLLGLYDTAERVIADAAAIQTPTQLLISGDDKVVQLEPQHRFFERLGSPIKEKHLLEGFYHDTLGEQGRSDVIDAVRSFILKQFNTPTQTPNLLKADQQGYTFAEHQTLCSPLSAYSPKMIGFKLARTALATAGRLSDGVRIGFTTGFDSGSTLDYIYRNQPSGITPLGRCIDHSYLNAIGWRGIRQRKEHLKELLAAAIADLRARNLPVHIVDIAAGHGRYILEALEGLDRQPDSVLLRDYSALNVTSGRALIAAKGMSEYVRFEQGDAFDGFSLADLHPKPTLAVVSGLYELFPDNNLVRRSLAGLGAAVAPGGLLVYTGQPWHPQLEFIARVLTSHRNGQSWVMRRRTQAEMDQLVEAAGFAKQRQMIDEWGIFSVATAQRLAA